MKKNITLIISMALVSMNCYATSIFKKIVVPQQKSFNQLVNKTDSVPVKDYNYYYQKSKVQKTRARGLLFGGLGLGLLGLAIGDSKKSSFGSAAVGGVMGIIGILSIIGSISAFNASGRNKKAASLSLENQQVYNYFKTNSCKSLVSLSLKIPLDK
ncbi:MAG: hypothetical protein ABIP30_11525 [Ferruginibacter sp.]